MHSDKCRAVVVSQRLQSQKENRPNNPSYANTTTYGTSWVLISFPILMGNCYCEATISTEIKPSLIAKQKAYGTYLSIIHLIKVPVRKIQAYSMISVVEFLNHSTHVLFCP